MLDKLWNRPIKDWMIGILVVLAVLNPPVRVPFMGMHSVVVNYWNGLVVAVAVAVGVDFLVKRFLKNQTDGKSAAITGLLVGGILTAEIWAVAVAAAVAILSKFFRPVGRHLFNPAAVGLVAGVLLGGTLTWWIFSPWWMGLIGGIILVTKLRKWLTVGGYLIGFTIVAMVGGGSLLAINPFLIGFMLIDPVTSAGLKRSQVVYGLVGGAVGALGGVFGELAGLLVANLVAPLQKFIK